MSSPGRAVSPLTLSAIFAGESAAGAAGGGWGGFLAQAAGIAMATSATSAQPMDEARATDLGIGLSRKWGCGRMRWPERAASLASGDAATAAYNRGDRDGVHEVR